MGADYALTKPIILFDGVCNLCKSSVQFIIKRDSASHFMFASLQSEFGKQQLMRFGIPVQELNSVLLIQEDRLHQKSDAALEISRRLDGLWWLLYGFKIVPSFIRDIVYDFIARNRYRWFGKEETCMVPTPELKSRFIN